VIFICLTDESMISPQLQQILERVRQSADYMPIRQMEVGQISSFDMLMQGFCFYILSTFKNAHFVFNGYLFTQFQHHNQTRNMCSSII